jgi:hypothetical protein
MSGEGPVLTDTSDMRALHRAFIRAFGEAPGQLELVGEGETGRASRLADYLGEVLWMLHAHHGAEDEILYPLLRERAPGQEALFSRMDAQHEEVTLSLDAAEDFAQRFGASGAIADGRALSEALTSLLSTIEGHFSEEEEGVLPVAARCVTPPEWASMPGHAMSHYTGTRIWLPFGLALEAMPEQLQANVLGHLPPPVSQMWSGGGADAFATEMAEIRGGAS